MKCRCANIITMMCLTLVLIGFACDATTAAGAVVGDGTPESCTQDALQAMVTEAVIITVNQEKFKTITFDCGSEAKTINVTTRILVGTDPDVTTIIDGGGNRIIIDGGNSSRLFEVYRWTQPSPRLRPVTQVHRNCQPSPSIHSTRHRS